MIAYTYPLLDLFWSIFVFFGFFLWMWVLITVFADIFRSRDLSGWGKAAWFLLVLVLPLFGALIYLIARGHSMEARTTAQAEAQEAAFRDYVKEVAASPNGTSTADELSKLAALADKGAITQQEYAEQKAKLLGQKQPQSSQPAA